MILGGDIMGALWSSLLPQLKSSSGQLWLSEETPSSSWPQRGCVQGMSCHFTCNQKSPLTFIQVKWKEIYLFTHPKNKNKPTDPILIINSHERHRLKKWKNILDQSVIGRLILPGLSLPQHPNCTSHPDTPFVRAPVWASSFREPVPARWH